MSFSSADRRWLASHHNGDDGFPSVTGLWYSARSDASFSNTSAALLPSWVRSSLCFKAMGGPLASKFESKLSLLIRCADAVLHQLAERLFVSYARSALPSLHHNSGRDSLLSD